MSPAVPDPTTEYAERVIAGEIITGEFVRLACKRHLDDLRHGIERGLRFDISAARRVFRFYERKLRHIDWSPDPHANEFVETPFMLMPFQQFIIGSLFGWKTAYGFRRFRTFYGEIGKGNGKTPLAAGAGLYCFVADREPGAQIYSAAVTRDQANLSFTDAERMGKASPDISEEVEFNVGNMAVLRTNSYFRPLSSEHRALSGQRVHMAIIDELHEHPNASVLDKITAGTKARRQSLIFQITNSGYDRNSVCYRDHEYSVKVLRGIVQDDRWFAYVCQLDPCAKCAADGRDAPNEECADCDDWRDEGTWIKANPGLGEILPREYLENQVRQAVGMPSKQNIVRRLNFCQWTEQAVRWIPMSDWDACPRHIDLDALKGRPCYGGIDLSSKIDLTAWVLVFPPSSDDPCWIWLPRFFVPKDNVRQRAERDRVPYPQWIGADFISATEGNVVDYDVVRTAIAGNKREFDAGKAKERIIGDAEVYSIEEIGFDPWNATQISTQLITEGFRMVETRQGTMTMNEPSKELEALVRAHRINHGGNPVLRWNASNVSVKRDHNDNLMPDKERSTERIDGIVAGLIAMARAIRNGNGSSVYESRGILRLADL